MNVDFVQNVAASLPPVFVFLAALTALDSYKLVPTKSILVAIGVGCLAAVPAFILNVALLRAGGVGRDILVSFLAPPLEETCKALYVVILMRRARIGFLIDAALYGFAIGAGFSLVENIYYLSALPPSTILVWIVRGFGTAIMHGSCTAIFAVMAKHALEKNPEGGLAGALEGWILAVVIHAGFNNAFVSPVIMTLIVVLVVPALFIYVFQKSEQSTRRWLTEGLDSDIELLEMVLENRLEGTRLGMYLTSIQSRFPGEIIGDMLSLMHLNLELSMRVKGILMMREMGLEVPPDPESASKLQELHYLQKSIGPTGLLALNPFLPHSTRELWQLTMVEEG